MIARIHLDSRAAAMPYLLAPRPGHEDVPGGSRTWYSGRAECGGTGGPRPSADTALEGDMLEHLCLRPDVRRQGIGTLLLGETRRRSPLALSLHVFQRNTEARAFHERHGFRVLGTSDGSGNTGNLPDMTLRRTASPDPVP